MSGSTVLIVDDERTLARAIKAFLTESGYEAEVAGDAEQALGLLETLRPDVVFSDVRLPGMNGIELLRRIREFDAGHSGRHHDRPRHHRGRGRGGEARRVRLPQEAGRPRGAQAPRRPRPRDTRSSAGAVVLPPAGRGARRPLAGVIGKSPAIREVLDQARQIAALDETPPVLIIGETGTGKGLVARTIHAASPRGAAGPSSR